MNRKIGYLLLLCGLALLASSAVMMWRIAYGAMEPPQAFGAEGALTVTMLNGMTVGVPIPPQVNRFGNLSLAFMLMFFIALVGGRVGALGVSLINGPAASQRQKETP